MFWTSTGQNPYILHGTICFSLDFLKEQVKISLLTILWLEPFEKSPRVLFFVVIWAQFSVDFMNKMMNFELSFDFFSNSQFFSYEAWFSLFSFKNSLSWLYSKFNISKTSSGHPIFLCMFEISTKFGSRKSWFKNIFRVIFYGRQHPYFDSLRNGCLTAHSWTFIHTFLSPERLITFEHAIQVQVKAVNFKGNKPLRA